MNADVALAQSLPADDRGFLYGDAVFETMLAVDGRVLWWPLHRDRLLHGARRLSIPVPEPDIECALRDLPPEPVQSLRLTLSRGSGPRGYDPGPCSAPRLRLLGHPLPRDPRVPLPAAQVEFSSVTMAEQPLLAGIKHGNRLEQVLAAAELASCDADDALLLNASGHVQCAIAANVFALCGDTLCTPPCDRAGVAGTRRRLLLEKLAPQLGLRPVEAPLSPRQCQQADALMLTSALIGVRAVARLGSTAFDIPHPVVSALQRAYATAFETCAGI